MKFAHNMYVLRGIEDGEISDYLKSETPIGIVMSLSQREIVMNLLPTYEINASCIK